MAANPSWTRVEAILATSAGVPVESMRAQILTFDDLLDISSSVSLCGYSMFKKLELCLTAMALRIAISKPHLTLGKIEDACPIKENFNTQKQ